MSLAPAPAAVAKPRPSPASKPGVFAGVGGAQPPPPAVFSAPTTTDVFDSCDADFVSPSGGAHVFDSSDGDFVPAAPPKPAPQPAPPLFDFSAAAEDFVAPPPKPAPQPKRPAVSQEELARIRAASAAEAIEAQRRLESKWAAQLRDHEKEMAAQPPTPFSSADVVRGFIHGAEACVHLRAWARATPAPCVRTPPHSSPLCPSPPIPPKNAQRAPAKAELA